MSAPLKSFPMPSKVGHDAPPRNGKSAEITDFRSCQRTRDELRRGVSDLFHALFGGGTHYAGCCRASSLSGWSPDTWDRIARKAQTASNEQVSFLRLCARSKMTDARVDQILYAKALAEHEQAMRGRE